MGRLVVCKKSESELTSRADYRQNALAKHLPYQLLVEQGAALINRIDEVMGHDSTYWNNWLHVTCLSELSIIRLTCINELSIIRWAIDAVYSITLEDYPCACASEYLLFCLPWP